MGSISWDEQWKNTWVVIQFPVHGFRTRRCFEVYSPIVFGRHWVLVYRLTRRCSVGVMVSDNASPHCHTGLKLQLSSPATAILYVLSVRPHQHCDGQLLLDANVIATSVQELQKERAFQLHPAPIKLAVNKDDCSQPPVYSTRVSPCSDMWSLEFSC